MDGLFGVFCSGEVENFVVDVDDVGFNGEEFWVLVGGELVVE